jgi:hypothetical protein
MKNLKKLYFQKSKIFSTKINLKFGGGKNLRNFKSWDYTLNLE